MFVSYLKGNQKFLTGISMVITTSVFNKADSGPGLLPEEESSPRLWRSRTSSAICRPILLTSTWLEINLSNPPLPTIIFRRVKRNEFNQVKYNHANYTKHVFYTHFVQSSRNCLEHWNPQICSHYLWSIGSHCWIHNHFH